MFATYEFTVSGGDDDRKLVYSIEALTPPGILSVEMDVVYPDYLKLEPRTLKGGDQRVPTGSAITMRVKANMPLQSMHLTSGKQKPVELEQVAPDTFRFRHEAKKDLRYSLRLRGLHGEENEGSADTFILRVLKDQAPVLRVRTPSARIERAAKGFVLFGFNARDDYEVTRIRLHYKINEGIPRVLELGQSAGSAVRLLTTEKRLPDFVPAVAVMDFTRLRTDDDKPIQKGDIITCHIVADDSAGQSQRTRADYRIAIAEESSRHVLGRQAALRESVDRTIGHLAKATSEMEEVRVQRGQDPREFRRWTGKAQASQARVLSDLDSLARSVREVFNLYVFNRMDGGTAPDQMLPYYERHLLEAAGSGSAFSGSLYRDLWRAQTERAIRARGALVKLLEMADLTDRLAADHAPRAYKAIARISATQPKDQIDAAIAEAGREQKTIAEGLARLRRLMSEWQSYEGVVRFFKDLKRREQDLKDKLDGLGPSTTPEGD